MKITDILSLLGGLALFLHGMQMMSSGLEAAAGNRMKSILEKLTSNRLLGVLVGAVITAVIQSSSATTVMVVGFVNSGMMTRVRPCGSSWAPTLVPPSPASSSLWMWAPWPPCSPSSALP